MNHNHKDSGCNCDLCTAKKMFVEELQKRMEITLLNFIVAERHLPAPEALEELVKSQTDNCAYEVLVGLVAKMVEKGILPQDVIAPPQPESQLNVAGMLTIPISHDRKVN